MRIEQLKYFCEIATAGSFSAAAQNLFIAQPSLTESIKKLEKELGYELFKRTQKGVVLTRKGQEILPVALNILSEIDYMYLLNKQYICDEFFNGTLNISAISSIKNYIQTAIILLSNDYPHMNTVISFNTSKQIINQVMQNECDIGILNMGKTGFEFINTKDFELHYLFYRNIYFIVSKDSPLANQKNISITSAAKHNFSILSDGKAFPLFDYLFNNISPPRIAFSSTEFSLTLDYIKNFDSIGLILLNSDNPIIPKSISNEFVLIPLREPVHIDFYCYYSKSLSQQKKEILHTFLDYFERCY